MASPNPQESINGLWVGDSVGVVTRHAGHIGKVEEILENDFVKNRSLVAIRLPNGAIVNKWDKDLQFLEQRIEK